MARQLGDPVARRIDRARAHYPGGCRSVFRRRISDPAKKQTPTLEIQASDCSSPVPDVTAQGGVLDLSLARRDSHGRGTVLRPTYRFNAFFQDVQGDHRFVLIHHKRRR